MSHFKQLESFVSVAMLGSLSAAARAEGVAPAMIGRRMDALESRLGIKLLTRSTRRIALTSEGEILFEEAQRILRELKETESRISQGSAEASGHLRISAPAGFGRRHVAPLLPEFVALHPQVTVTLDLSDRLVDLIEERYDCAIRIGDLADSQNIGTRLADNRRVIVATPAYLERHGRPQTPDDLLRHNCLSFDGSGNQSKGWLLRHKGRVSSIRVKGNLACSDGSSLHEWTLAGCGLSWRSLWEVYDDIRDGRLVTVLDEYAAPPNGIFALTPERRHLPLRVKSFIDLLKERYSGFTHWGEKPRT
ncbi:LysR family transcriptional regulator [Paracandidimonas soli]|uniref:LysR family transcriptional regulator n=1 Tax=Paracandidimonas soli TaxID=1917182 RepID=A0A4R3V8G5_9BURK|nr:LysR family transcriptional regulator [Paracandidimonas soli]TCV01457.1 LysR family transcriptional regulator [Paracandidimonas soli]